METEYQPWSNAAKGLEDLYDRMSETDLEPSVKVDSSHNRRIVIRKEALYLFASVRTCKGDSITSVTISGP